MTALRARMRIRRAASSDLAELARLERRAFVGYTTRFGRRHYIVPILVLGLTAVIVATWRGRH